MRRSLPTALLAPALTAALLSPAAALHAASPADQEPYRLPPPEVVALVDAAPTPSVSFSPDGAWMLVEERRSLPSVEDLARPMLRLGGMRIDPVANGRYATNFGRGLVLQKTRGGEEITVVLPDGDASRLGGARWSHDSERFAFTLITDRGTQLWYASVDDPAQPRMVTDRLNAVVGGFRWMPDGRTLLCNLVPADRGPAPAAPEVPPGPNVQETAGSESPLRTYQDLLSSPYEEALFEYYATSELVMLPTDGGEAHRVAGPAIWRGADPSPDGRFLLLTRVEKPWSYLMPYWSFPHTVAVLDTQSGESWTVEEVPLAEGIPIGGVREGKRNISWAPLKTPSLVWVEALDGGDPEAEVPHRDVWMQHFLLPDEDGSGQRVTTTIELAKTEHRARGLSWMADGMRFITSEYDRDRRWSRTLLHDRNAPDAVPVVLEDRSNNDRYADPGRIVYTVDEAGNAFVREQDGWIYRVGRGASPEGDLPFLARQSLATGALEELWRCEPGWYESVAEVLEEERDGMPVFLTRREAPDVPPNYWWRAGAAEAVQLTDFEDPQPQLRGVHKELVKYERSDGVPLSATLYLPADYQQGERLPLFVWAYPREYNDPSTAGQISGSPWRFTRIASSSHLHLLTQGYAILDGATMPVIGDPETMNDTFVEQIVAAAQAAIDYAVERGVADRERVACGGHSYGAFMTANLLAHCDLFKTGIARSGAYNRTLTPFGFQSERRTFWEAPEAYFGVSPFMHADHINEPMLMIHGEVDNNSGTFPMQSRRMFQAIKGNGGTARLVMLPHESHGYRARESVLHVLAEMIDWLDLHLGAGGPAPASATR